MEIRKFFLLLVSSYSIFVACNGKDDKDVLVLENKRRIECEKRSAVCNGSDGLRFYQSMPTISLNSNGAATVREVWNSFVVCCDDFPRLIDNLILYKHLLDSAIGEGFSYKRSDSIGKISIYAGFESGMWMGKRWESINFGDSTLYWSMPLGEYFEKHILEMQEAYSRCCL